MSINDEFNRFDCECGATIFFKKINMVVREWSKYHEPHMEKYVKNKKLTKEGRKFLGE